MGTRYLITVECPACGHRETDVYYAPTCGFVTHTCKCGCVIDLEEYTGISEEEASNADLIEEIVGKYADRFGSHPPLLSG